MFIHANIICMTTTSIETKAFQLRDLKYLGIENPGPIYWNLKRAKLYEEALKRDEAKLSAQGALVAYTGKHTGRSAQDKFIVEDEVTKDTVDWGKTNKPVSEDVFNKIRAKVMDHLNGTELFVQDTIAGADRKNSINVRIITEKAWHSLFMRNMLEAVNSTKASEAKVLG